MVGQFSIDGERAKGKGKTFIIKTTRQNKLDRVLAIAFFSYRITSGLTRSISYKNKTAIILKNFALIFAPFPPYPFPFPLTPPVSFRLSARSQYWQNVLALV